MPELQDAIVHIGVPGLNGGGVSSGTLASGLATRAPMGATYITQTANAELTAEQALSSLSTGLVKVTTGTGVLSTAVGADLPSHSHTGIVVDKQMIIDGGGSVITTGIKGDFRMTHAATITEWNLFADVSGSIQIDLWKDAYGNYPPVDADSITGSQPISMSGVSYYAVSGTGISSWTKSLASGDIIRINVDSASTITRVTLVLWMTRTI
jgi:hypothetical protein